jgi:hypothetical protein
VLGLSVFQSYGRPVHPEPGAIDSLLVVRHSGITGPKALEFYDDFANHRATLLKADGKDILSVKLILNAERAEEAERYNGPASFLWPAPVVTTF